jgi:nucleoside-diphosphate-sugar epimerase
MHVFVTGATGFIGMATTKELIAAGHQVLGLYRDEGKADALAATGAEPYAGSLEDLEGLKRGAAQCDGVIHLAFNHDFAKFAANCETDRRAIAALGEALAGTNKPLIVTSGTAIANAGPGTLATEDSPIIGPEVHPRAMSEPLARSFVPKGVKVSIIRLPQVHDPLRQGLISPAIQMFRAHGFCAYIGEGNNRWPATAVLDVARLYRLAFERSAPDAIYHAVAEEGVTMRDVMETVAKRLEMPVKSIPPDEAAAVFGWMAMFAAMDMPASGAKTRQTLGWTPTGPSLLDDLRRLPADIFQTGGGH